MVSPLLSKYWLPALSLYSYIYVFKKYIAPFVHGRVTLVSTRRRSSRVSSGKKGDVLRWLDLLTTNEQLREYEVDGISFFLSRIRSGRDFFLSFFHCTSSGAYLSFGGLNSLAESSSIRESGWCLLSGKNLRIELPFCISFVSFKTGTQGLWWVVFFFVLRSESVIHFLRLWSEF